MVKNFGLSVSSWAAAAALALVACGSNPASVAEESGSPQTTEASGPTTSEVDEVEPGLVVTEQDLVEARASIDAARQMWEAAALTDYTLEIGYESLAMYRLEVVGGEVVSEELLQDGAGLGDPQQLPRSTEEIFQQVEDLIVVAENDPSLVLPAGECGYHFNLRFGSETGHPIYYDALGPCDDGVGVRIEVITP